MFSFQSVPRAGPVWVPAAGAGRCRVFRKGKCASPSKMASSLETKPQPGSCSRTRVSQELWGSKGGSRSTPPSHGQHVGAGATSSRATQSAVRRRWPVTSHPGPRAEQPREEKEALMGDALVSGPGRGKLSLTNTTSEITRVCRACDSRGQRQGQGRGHQAALVAMDFRAAPSPQLPEQGEHGKRRILVTYQNFTVSQTHT